MGDSEFLQNPTKVTGPETENAGCIVRVSRSWWTSKRYSMIQPRLYVSSETSTRKRGKTKTTCSRCEGPIEVHRLGKQSYCLACHALYMRLTRPKHSELKPEAKLKANARAYAHTYRDRGFIEVKQCEACGDDQAEMHHEDYSQPLKVKWLCRPCHLGWHRIENGKAT
jgi:hypothetical protein